MADTTTRCFRCESCYEEIYIYVSKKEQQNSSEWMLKLWKEGWSSSLKLGDPASGIVTKCPVHGKNVNAKTNSD